MGKKPVLDLQFFRGELISRGSIPNLSITNNNCVFENGSKGKALKFNGSSSYLSIGDNDGLDFPGTPFTYEFYLRLPFSAPAPLQYVSYKGPNGIECFLYSDSTLRFGKANVASWAVIAVGTYFGKNTHIVFGWDGTNAFCYINDTVAHNTIQSTNLIEATTSALTISGSSYFLSADVYLARIYNYALSPQEVAMSYAFCNSLRPMGKQKRGFARSVPTDLSAKKNDTLGTEKHTNFDFRLGDTAWTKGVGVTITTNGASWDGSQVTLSDLYQTTPPLTVGKTYRITYQVQISAGLIKPWCNDFLTSRTVSGVYNETFTAATSVVTLTGDADFIGTVKYFSIKEVSGLVAAYNMKPVGTTLPDISSNGANVSLYPLRTFLQTQNGVLSNAITSFVAASAPSGYSSNGNQSVVVRFKVTALNPAGYMGFWSNRNTTEWLTFGLYAAAANPYLCIELSGESLYYNSVNLYDNLWHTAAFTKTGNDYVMYLDGVSVKTFTRTNTITGTYWRLLNWYDDATQGFVGECSDLRIYNKALTASEVKDYHNSFAKTPYILEDFSSLPCDGTSIVPRGWIQGTGTFKGISIASDDTVLKTIRKGTKALQCLTPGTISIPSNQAYGVWEWDFLKGADANNYFFALINTNTLAGNNGIGYNLHVQSDESIRLLQTTGSGNAVLNITAPSYIQNNVWYRIRITRTTAGVFTVLIKGGSFTPTAGYNGYTLVSTAGGSGTNPVTSTDYTSSNYLVLDLDSADCITNISLYPQIPA